MAKLVPAGVTLRKQTDLRWPGRDRRSDGWVGDAAHSARKSDHNPDKDGWVHALDIDENMGKRGPWRNGRTARQLANQLRLYAASDLPGADRIKYVVYEGRLTSGTYRATWWKWRKGNWGHYQHIHISFTSKAKKDERVFPLPILTKDRKLKKLWWEQLRGY
jgi:hypothetical protein